MYKQKIIACLFILALLYACSSEEDSGNPEGQLVNLTIESPHTFKAGDAIGLFVEKRTNPNAQSTVGNSNYKTNIKWVYKADGSWKPASSDDMIYTSADGIPLDIYAYYPYSEQAKVNEIAIALPLRIMTGKALNISNTSSVKLTFSDKTSFVKVIIPDIDILSSVQVSILDVLSGGTIYPAKLGDSDDFEPSTTKGNQSLAFENGYFVAYLPEQVFEKNKHILNIKDGDNTIEYKLPEQLQISTGKENLIVANYPVDNLADLPNTFMLKSGNEIFISVQKAYKMWRTNSLLASTSPDLTGEVTAKIAWQEDLTDVIENIGIIGTGENAVIHVKTKPNKAGNAVIAAKIGETIRWSWQLWVSDYNPSSKENGTTYGFNGLTFMDRNLGATVDPKTGGERTFGFYYQWGRKDPFSTRGKVETLEVATGIETNLANSIMYPDTYITSSSNPNDWYTKTGNSGLDRWNSDQNLKTVFDPCPKGWRVPVAGTDNESPWNGLALPEDENKWGNGWYFEGTPTIGYYPAVGQRSATASITYTGSAGFYYTAKPNATMRFDFTAINLSFGGGRAAGRSVRCVRE